MMGVPAYPEWETLTVHKSSHYTSIENATNASVGMNLAVADMLASTIASGCSATTRAMFRGAAMFTTASGYRDGVGYHWAPETPPFLHAQRDLDWVWWGAWTGGSGAW